MRLAIGLILLLISVGPAEAIWAHLTPEQIREALAHGKATFEQWRTTGRPIDDMDPEYVVDRGPEIGRAILSTEFALLALEARRWTAIRRELGTADIEQILSPLRGRLLFSVTLVGPNRDFLRHYTVHLDQGDIRKEPTSWNVFRGSPTPDAPSRFTASVQYIFLLEGLSPTAPVVLVMRAPDGQELRFDFDLSRLR